jgi:hypothetical protein
MRSSGQSHPNRWKCGYQYVGQNECVNSKAVVNKVQVVRGNELESDSGSGSDSD